MGLGGASLDDMESPSFAVNTEVTWHVVSYGTDTHDSAILNLSRP